MSQTLVATQSIDRIYIYGFIAYTVTTNDTDVTLLVDGVYGASYDEATESGSLNYPTKLDIYVDNSLWKSVTVGYIDYQTVSYTKSFPRSETKTHTLMLKASVYGYTTSNSTNFTVNVRTYSVTYNANGGSGAPASQTKTYSKSLTLSSTKPTRPEFVFRRWNTNTSDSGTAYNPGASYTGNANLTLYAIWNPVISYDANGGSGAPASQAKTFGQALTLRTATPTRTGYTFAGWNTKADGTGTSYAAGASFTSNTATKLYAKWTKVPDPPTISSLTVVRSNSSGNASNSGTYCKVTAHWSIDTTNVSGNTATVTGTIAHDGGSPVAFSFTSGASGTSGTAVALISGCDTDHQYTVAVTVTDRRTFTTRSNIMTRAFFVMDLKAGGTAMGIGSAAPESGLEVGWDTQFDEDVSILQDLAVTGNLVVTGNLSAPQLTLHEYTSDIATASSGWTVGAQKAYVVGNTCMVLLTLYPTSAITAPVDKGTIATIKSAFTPKLLQGFSNRYGIGEVSSGGSVSFRALADIATTTAVYVGLAYIK